MIQLTAPFGAHIVGDAQQPQTEALLPLRQVGDPRSAGGPVAVGEDGAESGALQLEQDGATICKNSPMLTQ